MNQFSPFYSLTFLFFAGSSLAGAVPLYDNGPPNNLDGYEMTHWIQADDFTLGVGARLENAKFWSFEGNGTFQGSILWQIYSNGASNTPGTLLFSGTSTNVTHVATGFILSGYAEFVTTFDMTPISLPAGVYWLALHNGPLTNNSDSGRVYWETADSFGPKPSHSLIAPFVGQWITNAFPLGAPAEVAFQINGVLGPRVTEVAFSNDAPRISFTTAVNQTYRLEYKNSLADPGWTAVSGAEEVAGTGNIVAVSDPDPHARDLGRRFYRALLCPCQTVEGPRIAAFDFDAAPRISFTTIAGQLYRVEYKADLTSPSWTPLPGAELIGGTGQTVQVSDNDPDIRNLSRRFYRAILVQ